MEIKLSAIDQVWVSNIPEYKEDKIRNKAYLSYGVDNKWPNYLYSLYTDVVTLNTCVNAQTDYVLGNGIQNDFEVNKTGEMLSDLLRKCAFDLSLYGGFSVQVIRDLIGRVSEVYWLDFKNVRTNEKHTEFWYSDSWDKWNSKAIKYPAYDPEIDDPSSVLWVKSFGSSVYPICPFNGAVISCEIEKSINKYHLNEIKNNFCGNAIINFNNGQPNSEQKDEIEGLLNQKFSGDDNAGRILISYNDSKDNAVTVEKLSEDNLDERYNSLATRSKNQIYGAFRISPQLIGDTSAATGFNTQEYLESFKVYNRTVIRPIQKILLKAFSKLYDEIIINPFTLE